MVRMKGLSGVPDSGFVSGISMEAIVMVQRKEVRLRL
jgi:hypothetical protein